MPRLETEGMPARSARRRPDGPVAATMAGGGGLPGAGWAGTPMTVVALRFASAGGGRENSAGATARGAETAPTATPIVLAGRALRAVRASSRSTEGRFGGRRRGIGDPP